MSGSSTVLKEFLVRLGYKVDATGERNFVDGVNKATKTVNSLGTALKVLAAGGAAAGVMAWMQKMASSMEGLYFSSQRAGASAKNLQAFGYAAAQMGSSVEEARSAVQGFHQWMLNNPGSEMWLRQLGIGTRDKNGKLRDATDMLQDVGKKLATMPTYLQNQYGQLLGIPLNLRLALQQGMGGYLDDYRKMLAEAGLDSDKAAKRSHEFMVQVRGLGGAFQVLGLKIASALMGDRGGGGALDRFRHLLLSHSDQITRVVGKLADFLAKLFDRLLNWLDRLDWNKLDRQVASFLNGLDNLTQSFGAFKTVALAVAGVLAINVLGSITSVVGGLARMIPMLGTAAGGMSGLAVAAAGASGYAAGSAFYNRTGYDKTSAARRLGATVAHILAFFGDKDAQEAVDRANGRGPVNHSGDFHGLPSGVTRGIRNNNPGNLRTGAGGSFGQYGTPQDGLNALASQLMLYYTGRSQAAGYRKLTTLRGIISTYAPSSENNTSAYIADLARKLGVSPDAQLNLRNPAQLQALMRGIVQHENGMNPYSAEMFRAAAGNVAQGGRQAPSVHAETKIYVEGATNPEATAQAVASKQITVNQRLFRGYGVPVA